MNTLKLTTDSPIYNQFKDQIESNGTIKLIVGEDCYYYSFREKQKGYGRTALYLTVLFNGELYEAYLNDQFPNFKECAGVVFDHNDWFLSFDQHGNMNGFDHNKYDNIALCWNDDTEEGNTCRRRLNRFCGMSLIVDGEPKKVDLNGHEVIIFDDTYFNGTELEFDVEIEETAS